MVVNTCKMWSDGIKIAFLFQKLTKIALRLGALPPDPITTNGWGLRPQTLVRDTFEYISLFNTPFTLDICIF